MPAVERIGIAGAEIAATRAGEGPPVLLLHGFPGDPRTCVPEEDLMAASRTILLLAAVVAGCGARAVSGNAAGDLEGDGGNALSWRLTCGDPVCASGGHRDHGLPRCTVETAGKQCTTPGSTCDLGNDCNEDLVCSTNDPRQQAGGCPVSRASYKKDIHFLSDGDLESYRNQLLDLPVATYRYREAPSGSRLHLGFLIDGHESLACVEPERDQVDLYGYASMAVAALKVQAREIDELKKDVAALRKELETRRKGASNRGR
jgi:hypothetical protein